MPQLITDFIKAGKERILFVLLGNILLGFGVAIFKLAGLVNDPFDGMNMAMAEFFHMDYPVVQIIVNIFLFIFQLWLGRRLIGFGTIVNAFFLGYIAAFFYNLIPAPQAFVFRILVMFFGCSRLRSGSRFTRQRTWEWRLMMHYL